ncbi:DUF669 domain-containing protein, partial [Pseudomonas syringae]|uniref:DUF669 domain-containing protein n=1 Tax=Pseudomonas syringae TaxID=317 RepID=UPI0034D96DAC
MPDLSKFQADYDTAPTAREGGGARTDIPDGNYQAQVSRVELKESKAGDPMLEFELDLLGKYAGRKLWR